MAISLRNDQRRVYEEILENSNHKVFLIDDATGTGKTILSLALAQAKPKSTIVLVHRKEQERNASNSTDYVYTYTAFNMKYFNLHYLEANKMFSQIQNVSDLQRSADQFQQSSDSELDTIIVDTYTLMTPEMLFILYMIARNKNIKLIFFGDRIQLHPIYRSSLHNKNNFCLLQVLNDHQMLNALNTNKRITNREFQASMSRFRDLIINCGNEIEVKVSFKICYFMYCLPTFKSKFLEHEDFRTVYLTQTNKDIVRRLRRFEENLNATSTPYVKEPFRCKGFIYQDQEFSGEDAFYSYLLLVKGYKYVHIDNDGSRKVVELLDMVYDENAEDLLDFQICRNCVRKTANRLSYLKVRSVNDGLFMEIKRCYLSRYQIRWGHRSWLLEEFDERNTLYQFPLHPYCLTFAATTGNTIDEHVEVNVNSEYTTANSIYVGLFCVRDSTYIRKIHSENLLSLLVTEYMEKKHGDQDFYYSWPQLHNMTHAEILQYASKIVENDAIRNIQWCHVEDIEEFEKNNTLYLRIRRSKYNPAGDTELIEYARRMQENSAANNN